MKILKNWIQHAKQKPFSLCSNHLGYHFLHCLGKRNSYGWVRQVCGKSPPTNSGRTTRSSEEWSMFQFSHWRLFFMDLSKQNLHKAVSFWGTVLTTFPFERGHLHAAFFRGQQRNCKCSSKWDKTVGDNGKKGNYSWFSDFSSCSQKLGN